MGKTRTENYLERLADQVFDPFVPNANLSQQAIVALVTNAFENGTIREPVYGLDAVIARESLARPTNGSIGNLSAEFYRHGHSTHFDLMTCAIGLKEVKQFPVMLNISVASALSPEFWECMKIVLKDTDPNDIIFEILEHDVDLDADISHLEDLKTQGYRFALDDFSTGQSHSNRLAVFGNIVDFVKIDGSLIRARLESAESGDSSKNFETVVTQVKTTLPDVGLIAEHVQTREEANTLFNIGFTGVQGRDLKPEDFPYDKSPQSIANTPPACDH